MVKQIKRVIRVEPYNYSGGVAKLNTTTREKNRG